MSILSSTFMLFAIIMISITNVMQTNRISAIQERLYLLEQGQ